MTLKEEAELKIIENNLTYDARVEKWTAAYPWKWDPCELPDNREAVLRNLKSTERRLKRDPELALIYKKGIKDMIDRKVCRKLSEDEVNNYKGPVYYIAHHAVLKPSSTTTPCRIVFNSSANYKGHVLNDYYMKGPDMLNNMLGVLIRFREERIAMLGDISKMYHSIKIPFKDQMTHRFLWRELDEQRPVDTYAITTVNFGDRPSGTIAITTLKKTAEMSMDIFPDASKIILRNSYKDDIPFSVDSWEKALVIRDKINKILAKGGFKTKEWVSSSTEIGNDQKNKIDSKVDQNIIISEDKERVLGMMWYKRSDMLSWIVNIEDNSLESFTKRIILSQINKIYDPLGLIGPFTVRDKILMRSL